MLYRIYGPAFFAGFFVGESFFGNMYRQALQAQLQKIGNTLLMLRQARQEDINCVATAVNLRPEILQKIENGDHDFRFNCLHPEFFLTNKFIYRNSRYAI